MKCCHWFWHSLGSQSLNANIYRASFFIYFNFIIQIRELKLVYRDCWCHFFVWLSCKAYQFVRRDDERVSGTSPFLNVLKALRCQNILAFCSWHCQNWPCLLSQCHLHNPYHHSNSDFPYPHLSVRATASKMLNNADLLWKWMNGPVMGFSL